MEYVLQHAHTLPNAPPPISVHMTYQFAEGAKFAYGKHQPNPSTAFPEASTTLPEASTPLPEASAPLSERA